MFKAPPYGGADEPRESEISYLPMSTQTSSTIGCPLTCNRPLKIPNQLTLGNEKEIGKWRGGSIAERGTYFLTFDTGTLPVLKYSIIFFSISFWGLLMRECFEKG